MDVFASIVLVLYCVMLIALIIGIVKIRPSESAERFEGMITVIVPVRNEARNITHLLSALANQPDKNFEVIFVDDHSTDTTSEIVNAMLKSRWRIVRNEGIGKKAALTTGVKMAKGALIVTTDADCTFHAQWLWSIRNSFAPDQAVLTFGAVRIKEDDTLFAKAQALEFASVVGTGMSTASLGFPTMCNGANLAFKKSVFERVGGYEGNEQIASGDDEFLMRKILLVHPDGVLFDGREERLVTTNAASSWRSLISQRLRWAGKWRYNSSVAALLLAIFIMIAQVATICAIVRLTAGVTHLGFILLAKMLIDALFIFLSCRHVRVRFFILPFLLLELGYPFYVLVVGFLSNFIKPKWKDRSAGV